MRYAQTLLGAMLLALVGCGNNNDGNSDSADGAQGDSFIDAAAQLAATAPEDAEASDVDAIVETAPEDAEPEDVG